MKEKPELHIVIDEKGVRSVQIPGNSETQVVAHQMYLRIEHLIPALDEQIQAILNEENAN